MDEDISVVQEKETKEDEHGFLGEADFKLTVTMIANSHKSRP